MSSGDYPNYPVASTVDRSSGTVFIPFSGKITAWLLVAFETAKSAKTVHPSGGLLFRRNENIMTRAGMETNLTEGVERVI